MKYFSSTLYTSAVPRTKQSQLDEKILFKCYKLVTSQVQHSVHHDFSLSLLATKIRWSRGFIEIGLCLGNST